MIASLRRKFLAGVLVTVPVIATYLALRFLFRHLDALLGPLVAELIGRRIPGLGVLATLMLVLVVGLITSNYVGRRAIGLTEKVFCQVPLVRKIYRASKDIVTTATLSHRQVFREVVLVEYPRKGLHSYGFVSSYTTCHGPDGVVEMANVFIPNPPVPTSGFLVAMPVRELVRLDVSVEEALKLVLSAGMVTPSALRTRGPTVSGDGAGESTADPTT